MPQFRFGPQLLADETWLGIGDDFIQISINSRRFIRVISSILVRIIEGLVLRL